MDLLGVAKQENFGLTVDGACEADRPAGQEKNKKYIPTCAGVSAPSIHPFKKPDAYAACWNEANAVQPRGGLRAAGAKRACHHGRLGACQARSGTGWTSQPLRSSRARHIPSFFFCPVSVRVLVCKC